MIKNTIRIIKKYLLIFLVLLWAVPAIAQQRILRTYLGLTLGSTTEQQLKSLFRVEDITTDSNESKSDTTEYRLDVEEVQISGIPCDAVEVVIAKGKVWVIRFYPLNMDLYQSLQSHFYANYGRGESVKNYDYAVTDKNTIILCRTETELGEKGVKYPIVVIFDLKK